MDIALSQPVSLWDGLVLICILLVSRYGFWLQTYGDVGTRQWVSSLLGFIIASFVLDDDVGYFMLVTFTTITLICLVGPKFCHIVALVTMFGYLSYYRIQEGDKMSLIANYLLATTTLNLTGIALEINKAYKMNLKGLYKPTYPVVINVVEENLLKLNFLHIFHYTFCYITIFTGPYVRYQVYADFTQVPYAVIYKRPSLSEDVTFSTIPFWATAFWILQNVWPTSYSITSDFTVRSILYKLIFSAVLCLKFRLLAYLYNCIRQQLNMYAGFGVYDRFCESVAVYGPAKYPNDLKSLVKRRFNNVPTDIELEMETVKVTNPLMCELSTPVSSSVKYWNKGLSYWLDEYIDKSLLEDVKSPRTRFLLTSLICLLWHGTHPSLLILGATALYYLHVESIFLNLLNDKDQSVDNVIHVGLWLSKQFIFSWCLMPYFIHNISELLSYYQGTYFIPLFFLIAMHFLGSHLNVGTAQGKKLEDEVISDSEKLVTFKM